MVRHWTPKPVIICSIRSSPTGDNFLFAVVKSFEYKIAISANFVQTVKNSNVTDITFCDMCHNASNCYCKIIATTEKHNRLWPRWPVKLSRRNNSSDE